VPVWLRMLLYKVRQNKISQCENHHIYIGPNAKIFLHKIFHIYLSRMSSQISFNFTQLTYYLAKWRSIKVNVPFSLINSLRYLTFSSVRAVYDRRLSGFRSVADPRSSTRLQIQIAFTEQSFQPFSGNIATLVWYPNPKFPQCIDPSFIFVR